MSSALLALALLATAQESVRCDRFGIEPTFYDEKTLDAVADAGVGWISVRLGWGDDAASAEAAIAGAAERKLSVWCTLAARESADAAGFTAWVRETVAKHPSVRHWSIERHVGLVPGAKMELLRAARTAMREANEDARFVVGVSASEAGVRALKPLLADGLQDVADVVAYIAFTSEAESSLKAAREAFDEAGRDPEAWVMMSAVASGGKNSTKSQASAFLQGACAYLRHDRDIKRLFWYPLQDGKNDPDQPETTQHDQKGGLIAESGTRRPVFDAIKRTAAKLDDGESLEYVEAYGAAGVTVYRVEHAGGGRTFWAWAPTTSTKRSQLVLPYPQETTITDVKGETTKAAEHEKGRLIDLFNEPVMIEIPE
ncbi:MAG: hypothetical protein A3F84_22115 [Candidatus Handelsmanbacteria bacterium RIFCSPLOWO2_12_FULL_64_10]|uniref:Uncharacterized protein n=1 Tax=Handelsmanbacteria sp. (strain RIFCSPLOWO2_12_FULL_64_10) TaxID=1817868 RepID=A0A1F6CRN8_HANXR|nr:MAG: hypothetical protein A3F84_22115 [Candidatus Handelsmanbacteria bacterium RIFCSPLOWO2_12_FULL_64_10]